MKLHRRKDIRLKCHDYTQSGYYFITICTKENQEILSNIDVGARIARPSEIGKLVECALHQINEKYESVILDKYVIMPNHIHMILIIRLSDESGRAMRAPTISTVINQFKGYATKQIGFSIWQKLFHDRIIRNEDEYRRIWQYIDNNPADWTEDKYFVKSSK